MMMATATREEIRYSPDCSISMVYSDGNPVRCPTQHDIDCLPVSSYDMTQDEIENLDD